MMQCQICGDSQGPFEIADIKKRVLLVCENCAKKARKEQKNELSNTRSLPRFNTKKNKRKKGTEK